MGIVKLKIKNCRQGYATLELLFYIAFFVVLSLAVINAMVTMAKSFRETALQVEFAQTGNIMERMSREIRLAYSVNIISAGDLKLNTQDFSSGAAKTVEFLLSDGQVQLIEDDIFIDNLNTTSTTITDLIFTPITTAESEAVQIFLSFQSANDRQGRIQNFYNTVVLRGSY